MRDIFWLSRGTEGDDTDGHIDNLARFVGERTVLAIVEQDRSSANYEPLQENLARLREIRLDGEPLEIVLLPTVAKIEREDLVLPASYANFYIANEVRSDPDVSRSQRRNGGRDHPGSLPRLDARCRLIAPN